VTFTPTGLTSRARLDAYRVAKDFDAAYTAEFGISISDAILDTTMTVPAPFRTIEGTTPSTN
jgi:hypothetical protein